MDPTSFRWVPLYVALALGMLAYSNNLLREIRDNTAAARAAAEKSAAALARIANR